MPYLPPLPQVIAAEAELRQLGLDGLGLPRGWAPIVLNAVQSLTKLGVSLIGLRSKYAELRMDFDPTGPPPAEAITIATQATEASRVTCEICGRPGAAGWGAEWVRVLCPGCAAAD